MDNQFVAITLEGAKRTVGKPASRQKDPLTSEMAKGIVDALGPSPDLTHQRTIVICLLGFSGFLRISELLAIQVKHLKFDSHHLEITIPQAKNDQMREGHIVYIKRLHTNYCPVHNLQQYLKNTNLAAKEDNYVISRLAKTKRGHNAHGTKPLADSSVREIFSRDVAPICNDIEEGSYCLHSLRSGGASSAINNGVSERLIGKHGRWTSDKCRDSYLKDSKKQRLGVTASLGL